MGQCIGVDLIREDVEAFRREHAKMCADLAQLKEEFRGLDGELGDHCEQLRSSMSSVEVSLKAENSELSRVLNQNEVGFNYLKGDVIALHKEATEAAQTLTLLRQGMRKLKNLMAAPASPVNAAPVPKSFFKDDALEAFMLDSNETTATRPPPSAASGKKGKKKLLRSATTGGPSIDVARMLNDGGDSDTPSNRAKRAQSAGGKANMKRGQTAPNMSTDASISNSNVNIGTPVTVAVEKGDSLGLILALHYNYKHPPGSRSAGSVIAQLQVVDYVANGVSRNPSYLAGILIYDVICGVNGRVFSKPEDLSAALIAAYHDDNFAEHILAVQLMISERGNPADGVLETSKRRLGRAELQAKNRRVVVVRSPSAAISRGNSNGNSNDVFSSKVKSIDGTEDNNNNTNGGTTRSKRSITHVRKEDHPAGSVYKCGKGVWKFIIRRITTKAFRKYLGKRARRYCCRCGKPAHGKGGGHLNTSVSSRRLRISKEDIDRAHDEHFFGEMREEEDMDENYDPGEDDEEYEEEEGEYEDDENEGDHNGRKYSKHGSNQSLNSQQRQRRRSSHGSHGSSYYKLGTISAKARAVLTSLNSDNDEEKIN